MSRGIKAQMKYANKIGAKFVLVLGGNELASGEANLKFMKTGEQFPVHLDERFITEFGDLAVQFMFDDILDELKEEM